MTQIVGLVIDSDQYVPGRAFAARWKGAARGQRPAQRRDVPGVQIPGVTYPVDRRAGGAESLGLAQGDVGTAQEERSGEANVDHTSSDSDSAMLGRPAGMK
jgi:hypothetical protein